MKEAPSSVNKLNQMTSIVGNEFDSDKDTFDIEAELISENLIM